MQMSEKEIVRSYTNAKDKRSQVGVLAELNACPNDAIREILERNGISAPKPGRKSQKKEEPKKPKAQLTEKAKRLLKTEEPDDQGKKAERLIKTDETKKVGTCAQDVGTKSENRQLKIERSDQNENVPRGSKLDKSVIRLGIELYKDSTRKIEELEQSIEEDKLKLDMLKCQAEYLRLRLKREGVEVGGADDGMES